MHSNLSIHSFVGDANLDRRKSTRASHAGPSSLAASGEWLTANGRPGPAFASTHASTSCDLPRGPILSLEMPFATREIQRMAAGFYGASRCVSSSAPSLSGPSAHRRFALNSPPLFPAQVSTPLLPGVENINICPPILLSEGLWHAFDRNLDGSNN